MLKIMFSVLICILLTSCIAQQPVDGQILDSKGQLHQLADYRNKWLIINYWASWCKPCREEIPELNKFNKKHSDQAIIIGVNYDQLASIEKLDMLARSMQIKYMVTLSDPAPKLGVGSVDVLPTTVIIGPEGQVVKKLVGEQTSANLEEITGLF